MMWRIISKHIVRFSNNQPYFTWYVKCFCTLACWILLPVSCFSSSWLIGFLTTGTIEPSLSIISTQAASCVFQATSNTFILLHMLPGMCSTIHNEKSPQWFETVSSRQLETCVGNFLHIQKRIQRMYDIRLFQVPSLQRRVLFPTWLQCRWSPPLVTTSSGTVMELWWKKPTNSKFLWTSKCIHKIQCPSSYLGKAMWYDM